MKKIFLFELPERFCKWWHGIIICLHVFGGLVFTIVNLYQDGRNIASALIGGILIFIMSSVCFLIGPMICAAISAFVRFLPVIALPAYGILCVGNLFGDHNDISIDVFIKYFLLSIWGWFNIRTAVIANRDEDFNPFIILNS